jgi:hypothetical protein
MCGALLPAAGGGSEGDRLANALVARIFLPLPWFSVDEATT